MQPALFKTSPAFDGATLEKQDEPRLRSQMDRIKFLFRDQQWRTLKDIADAVGASEAGASARLRDFRKVRWGAYTVERQRIRDGSGQYAYRLVLPRS